jgi:hypothetical protein
MATFSNNFETKTSVSSCIEFICQQCDYKCFKKFNWDRHILTAKHLKSTNSNKISTKNEQNEQKKETYMCHACNKQYKDRTGLWRHKQKCKLKEDYECEIEEEKNPDEIHELKEIMKYLMKENSEMKNMMLEQQNMMMVQNTSTQNMMMDVIKTGTHNTTTTNSHNKTFNLNFFLNETCKNALNINEFVSSIKVSLDDLENTGRQGYIEGISSIILNKLKNLNHYDRPIHCADQKREILYIKNDNQWFKESQEKPLLTKAIKTIANENIKQIKTWRDKNPECTDSDSKKNNLYLKIVSNSMSGTDKEECDKNINKIISNVAKEVIIDK